MLKTLRAVALGLSVIVLAAACSYTHGETTGRYIDDSSTTAAVKAKLAGERAATLTRVDVETTRGVVTLTGIVPDEQTKDKASQLAASVNGVVGVNNNLQIQSQAPIPGQAATPTR